MSDRREQVINNITDMLRKFPFTFEFEVKEKPEGVKVIFEVTKEQMDKMLEKARKEENK